MQNDQNRERLWSFFIYCSWSVSHTLSWSAHCVLGSAACCFAFGQLFGNIPLVQELLVLGIVLVQKMLCLFQYVTG